MARNPKLKVFRTAIGFHDAYIAAPSQKAALEAWGAKSNLFARGVAEIVSDARLAATALDRPGEVIKVLRGSAAEQLAALGPASDGKKAEPSGRAASRRAKKPPPRPSRTALDAAEDALAAVEANHQREADALAREETALRQRQAALRRAQDRERAGVERKRDAARAAYDHAIAKWRDA